MGAGASTPAGPPRAVERADIVKEDGTNHFDEPSLALIPRESGDPVLALAYQASSKPHQGSRDQHIAFTTSEDGGKTWQPHRVVQWGLAPVWSPVLYWDAPRARLLLFYSESRKALTPGGDVKCATSTDLGATWSPPSLVWSHEAGEECPKVTAAPPVIDADGVWYLPVHLEPYGAYRTFNKTTYSELAAGEEDLPYIPPAPTATPQSLLVAAAVLVSRDAGASWVLGSVIEHPTTWLSQPTLSALPDGRLLALFRTALGSVHRSLGSRQAAEWTKPAATGLPNPNSKIASVCIEDQILAVHNSSKKDRAALAISLSTNAGAKWSHVVDLDAEPNGTMSSPSLLVWSDDTVKVVFSVLGIGLRLMTVQLPVEHA